MINIDLYWSSNDEWYEKIIDDDDGGIYYKIKSNAPEEAKRSYERFVKKGIIIAKEEEKTGANII